VSRQEALVTPSIMKWARERARLSTKQAAERIGQPVEEIEAWEKGEKYPSTAQARKASEAYKRSLAVFYLAEPPTDFDTIKDFRQPPRPNRKESSRSCLHAEMR
jgi:transcriptional regulator with XRE-family HTH domain